jgi:hypothetical protein
MMTLTEWLQSMRTDSSQVSRLILGRHLICVFQKRGFFISGHMRQLHEKIYYQAYVISHYPVDAILPMIKGEFITYNEQVTHLGRTYYAIGFHTDHYGMECRTIKHVLEATKQICFKLQHPVRTHIIYAGQIIIQGLRIMLRRLMRIFDRRR